jgi:hypothetical protein
MTETGADAVHCAECDWLFEDAAAALSEPRQPCPACGAFGRHAKKALRTEVTAQLSVSYAARNANRKMFAWGFSGRDWSHRLQKHVDKISTFAKRGHGNRRYEHITDPDTGEVVHHCDHPLTEHRDHGSAKPPPKN